MGFIMQRLNKSELFKLAHRIATFRDIKYYGSYRAAFALVLRELYAQGGQVWGQPQHRPSLERPARAA